MTTDNETVKDYADGWITERKGTGVPGFLKLSYIVITLACLSYLIVFKQGELTHATRGPLVRQFNLTSQAADGMIYLVIVLSVAGLVWLSAFAFGKPSEH